MNFQPYDYIIKIKELPNIKYRLYLISRTNITPKYDIEHTVARGVFLIPEIWIDSSFLMRV
ncbi:MAG: hypothetical protein DRQ48_07545 [Gammaproteobacteria bacterium]|nr:MAG: hypothetical protein DRQ48_07545 [Gammaproteobacteria bacterium]